jgi:hypothetical protein
MPFPLPPIWRPRLSRPAKQTTAGRKGPSFVWEKRRRGRPAPLLAGRLTWRLGVSPLLWGSATHRRL